MFFAIVYVGLALTTDTVTPCLLIGAYGLFTGCTDGVGKAWISGSYRNWRPEPWFRATKKVTGRSKPG